jgi:hypothetical protein
MKKFRKLIGYSSFIFLLVGVGRIDAYESEKILSVEIGSSRVKAALLPPELTFEDLKSVPIIVFHSGTWLGPDIVNFLSPDVDGSLANRVSPESYRSISISLSCDLWQNKINLSRSNLPRNLKHCFEQQTEKSVCIENDMVAWAKGVFYFQNLLKQQIEYPCLCISLGTGAAAAVSRSEHDLTTIMLHLVTGDFNRLRSVVRKQTGKEPGSGTLIGRVFFEWVKQLEFSEKEIQIAFQERFNAFLQDLIDFLREREFDLKTIRIGGGNSRYLSTEEININSLADLLVMNSNYFEQLQISADILSLLGALEDSPTTDQIPKFEDVYDVTEKLTERCARK